MGQGLALGTPTGEWAPDPHSRRNDISAHRRSVPSTSIGQFVSLKLTTYRATLGATGSVIPGLSREGNANAHSCLASEAPAPARDRAARSSPHEQRRRRG